MNPLNKPIRLLEAYQEGKEALGAEETLSLLEGLFGYGLREVLDEQTLLNEEELRRFRQALVKAREGVPLAYITGYAFFDGFRVKVSPKVLIPRQDTELLVRLAADFALNNRQKGPCEGVADEARLLSKPFRVLDLCCGSGIVPIALYKRGLREPLYQILASDISEDALSIARENARVLGASVDFYQGDLYEAVEGQGRFDLLTANPPYISGEEFAALPKEVKDYEPALALWGGEDGLSFYRRLIEDLPRYLSDQGKAFFEIGYRQKEPLRCLVEAHNHKFPHSRLKAAFHQDLENRDRVMELTKEII